MTIGLFTRALTGGDAERQIKVMRDYCKSNGWTVSARYIQPIEDAGDVERRRFMADAFARKFEHAMIWSVGSITTDGAFKTIEHLGSGCGFDYGMVKWSSYSEPFLSNLPVGDWKDAMLSVIACFAKAQAQGEQMHATGKPPARQ